MTNIYIKLTNGLSRGSDLANSYDISKVMRVDHVSPESMKQDINIWQKYII